MGKRVTVELFDDVEPELAAEAARSFSVEGVDWHLDLSNKNARAFDKDMEKWTKNATRVGRSTGGARKGKRITHSGGEQGLPLADIRRWAQVNGRDVSDRGRVSAEIVRDWKAAGSPTGDDIEPKKATPARKAPAAATAAAE